MEVETLLHTKSKAEVAAAVRAASSNNTEHGLLEQIVDRVLATPKSLSDVDDDESLDWCQWLIAGGSTPEEFSQTVKHYDKATTCGLVWTENFVAYRCRTCGISPYLSLCTDCFQKGNHEGHDFIVFRSETGGACDCGDINLIRESGCCVLHGPRGTAAMQRAQMLSSELNPNLNNSSSRGSNDPTSSSSTSSTSTPEQSAPPELFSIANGVMPRLFHRLIAYLRLVEARKLARAQQIHKNNMKPKKTPRPKTSPPQPVSLATAAAMMANTAVSPPPKGHKFIKLLQSFSDMGVAMRRVMTSTLTNPPVYKSLCGILNPEYERVGLQIPEHHQTFLEELVYWTVKREFPDDLKCLLLSLRTDTKYNEAFARAFITHYELISQSILKSSDPERLCKHIAAVSVQLFSNEKLAIAMVEQMQLLHLLLRILFDMIRSTAVPISSSSSPSSLLSSSGREEEISLESEVEANDISNNSCNSSAVLKVIDCDNDIIKNNYYWLIKSDLKELLSHGPVATKFFKDGQLLSTWFEFLTLLQGMNVNKFVKKGEPHIERESASYVGAFMAELVISATLMWTLVSHLKDCTTSDITRNFVRLCWKQLNEWYNYVKYPKGTISFHLPLHRYFSTFVRQGLQYQGMSLNDLLPNEDEFTPVVEQVLRLQVAYYGISTRLWARNGPSLVNQAEYYVSSLCCNSMVDADLFLLQVAAVKSPGVSENKFVEMVLREFGMTDVLSIRSLQEDSRPMMMTTQELEPEEQMTMLENCLIFLATLSSVRTNIGIRDEDLMALEMSVLLCKSDKLHSELMEMRTERCGSDGQLKNFETVLAEIADFQAPRNMQQGMFTPKPRVWEEIYDPLYTLLRSSNRAEYQCSRDRYQDYVNRSKKMEKSGSSKNLWPPFRIPTSKPSFITDPGRILLSKAFMEVTFVILYHGVNTGILSELTLSLCIYMLELCTFVAERGEDLHSFLTEVKIANKEDGNDDDDEMVSGGEDENNSESIVSLLLQLYTKLSESRKSYCLKPENDSSDDEMPSIIVDSRIGDGPIFIAKVLDKLAEKSEECRAYILSQIQRFQGDQQQSSQQELSTEEKEREERRRKAKERTLNWMNENAMKRPQIDAMEEDQDDSVTSESGGQQDGGKNLLQQFQDHQCCICFEKLESKPNNPFGLMTHLSPCSILGYQRLRTPEGNGPFLKSIHSETLDEFLKYYVDFSIIQHVPLDPGFGAQLESCGHFIHQACFTGYMNSVKKAPPPSVPSSSDSKPVISFTYKEYTCPVCRQLGNSFLPIILNNLQVKSGSSNNVYTFGDISKLLKKRNNCPLSKAEKTAVDSFIKDMDACAKNNFETDLLKMLKDFVDDSPLVSSFLLTSHLRLALERQLKLSESVSNSSGASSSSSSFPSKKLSYMLPLIAAIKHQYKSLPLGYAKKLAQNWEMVCGKRNSNGKREVPTLLRDVETTLFHFILSVPLENGGVNVFNGVVQAVYNLRVVQVLAAICSQFSERERREISRIFPQSQFKLEQIMSLILRKLEGRPETTVDILNGADENGNHKNADIPETQFIENLVQSLLIPFLRTAAQLKLEIFRDQLQSFPETFSELVTYLQLGERKINSANNVVTLNDSPKFCVDFLHWRNGENSDPVLEYEGVIGNWCSELIQSFGDSNGELPSVKNHWAAELLKSYLYIYDKPSLIRLPREYDTIFETYRKIKCGNCELVPSTPALCLVCGEVLCLNELCCFDLELKVSEVISHCQKKCGRGTGLFLSVLTSEILIVKEKEACIWGSIFLDSFCEEDLELRRGKPLFLCQERLDILQRNWIAQSFYKANLKWFQHRNFL